MSHLTVKDEVVRDDQNSQKWTKEMEEVGGSCPANTKETPTKKVKAEGSAKLKDKCVETCQPGPQSGCTIRGKGKPVGNLSCAEVDRRLEALGASAGWKNPIAADKVSLCVKAAIMKGLINITGEDKNELSQIVHSETWWLCGHHIDARLGDLLKQPDYAGTDFMDGGEDATVFCKEPGCEEKNDRGEGRVYVTGICEGKPTFDTGKAHNHCVQCPGFGQCIWDYREVHCDGCGKHYFGGHHVAYYCSCKKGREEKKKFGNGCSDDSD